MADDDGDRAQRRGAPDRVVAFSDGVFAIVITILVLEVGVPPDLPERPLREAIEQTGPELTAWVISFLLTGMYWVWHRDLFSGVRSVNRDVVWLNLVFLLPVSLIPFAAAAGDHQAANAHGLVEAEAAIMIREDAANPESLAQYIEMVLSNPSAATQMSLSALRLGKPEAAEDLADMVQSLATPQGDAA